MCIVVEKIIKNKLIIKSHQRFWSERHQVFPKEVKNIAFSAKHDKIQ